MLWEEMIPNFSIKWQKRTYSPIHFMITQITLIPKPDKDLVKKESHKPVSFIYIEVKILNKKVMGRSQLDI